MAVGLGSMAFTMEDVLLEPYGGEILKLSVSSTTLLTFTLALGGLIGFAWASRVITRGADPYQMASWGAWTGLPAFAFIILAAPLMSVPLCIGCFLDRIGRGLFAHGTLTASMNLAPPDQTGLAMGAWVPFKRLHRALAWPWWLTARWRGTMVGFCHRLFHCLRH
jgi:BCD family chlorophyll transporter-like MFS transporter